MRIILVVKFYCKMCCCRSEAKREAHRKRTTSTSNRPLSSIDGLDLFDSLGVERGHDGQVKINMK